MKYRVILGLVLMLVIAGCGGGESCENPTSYTVDNGNVVLDKEGTIPCDLCDVRGLHDKIIVLESEFCGACQVAMPLIEEVAAELGVLVIDLDLSKEGDALKMQEFGIMPFYTPTMVVDCDVYVGGKTKEEYTKIFGGLDGRE